MPATRIPPESFFIDRKGHRPIQTQIRETAVSFIQSGHAAPGTHLPSSRKLAEYLGVARMTVTLAYSELVAQGYLETQNRSGYVVATTDIVTNVVAAVEKDRDDDALDWKAFLASSLTERRRIVKPVDWRKLPYPFAYGQMDATLFNYAAWRDCARQAMGRLDFIDMAGDMADLDDPLLVNYIRCRSLPRRGISANPDEILITVGAQNGLWLAIELLTRQPLSAVCENPGYPDTLQALTWCGANVNTVDVDEYGLPPQHIPDGTRAVFITPSHHAPTGVTMPTARKLQLLADAEEKDFVIIEDDYDFEMSFIEPPSPSLKSYDRQGRVIYVGSFSKAMFPGLRLGYLVAPREFIAEARELRSMMLRHPPGHLQRTAAYFLAQGHYDLLIRDMRRKLAVRRAAVLDAIANTSLTLAGAAKFGGSSLWIKAPDGINTTVLAEDLLKDGVMIEPGAAFFAGHDGPVNFFRLGYSSIPAHQIEEGINLIARRVEKHMAAHN